MIILGVVVLAVGVYWLYFSIRTQHMEKLTAALPSPPSLPLLGNAMMFIGNTEKMLHNLEYLADLAHKHKGCVKIWLGPKLYIAIGNPEDAQLVLENCLDKDGVYRFLRAWLGHGLFVAPVGLWKTHRKVLLPVFHNKVVEEYLGVIGQQAGVLVGRLADHDGQGEFDVLKYITACTLDIVFETAMGERMDVQHTPDTPYLRARHTVISILNMRLFKVWLQPDCLFNLTSYAKQQRDNIDLTHKFTDEVVKKKRQEYENKKNQVDNDQTKEGKLQAVLDLLFGREIEFTNEQLREHIDSITVAGNDTTALVIAYTLVLLGVHQEVQEKVLLEQEAIFGSSRRASKKEDLQQMNYLERVIKESMRLYTVVPIIARNVHKDTYLPGCGVTLPAGAGAVIGSFAIHKSKAVWGANADDFDPDRFLPERSVGRHPAAFLPFSFGSRNCIGRNFGMLIMKSIISSIVRAYKINAKPIDRLKIEVLLFPTNGHQIMLRRR
ncbi:cytochrome P450 4c3-like isoform X1 [Plodia interpunctella]|uniref:cytochrome P450 4c3-like isoform X1 n=1 Tax=Plodia interpunctella TaxID=58824 RepID=UPI00236753AC|nr:cytochrome P450 4c3-like isoform X1 [Plodia interpunctella]XP_053610613.1 cytochrome P450 4c3-like isoform X1 [Plodia interpunctella]